VSKHQREARARLRLALNAIQATPTERQEAHRRLEMRSCWEAMLYVRKLREERVNHA
jgi:hypothetical protein